MKDYPTNKAKFADKEYLFTWMEGEPYEKLFPITQAYGLVFNEKGEILICTTDPKEKRWGLPGGTPEDYDKSLVDTLKRELMEEVDVTVKNIKYIGVQKGEVVGKPETIVYQTRFFAVLDELHDQTPDPDYDVMFIRKFVKPSEVNKYLNWGSTGQAVVDAAVKEWNKLKVA